MAKQFEVTRTNLKGNPRSRTLTAYYQNLPRRNTPAFPATQAINRLEESSRAGLLERAGASGGAVRQEETLPEFQVSQDAADIIPGVSGESPKPGIVTLFDFLARGSSGFVGFQSGLQALDRPSGLRLNDTEDRFQPDDTQLSVAIRRAGEGFRGEEVWRAADFGAIAEKKSIGEASRLERAFQATAGFGVDTILDPITYMSFGGSIMGRRVAANKIEGYAQKALREGLEIADHKKMITKAVEDGAIASDAVAIRLDGMVLDRITKLRSDARNTELMFTTQQAAKKLADTLEGVRNSVTTTGLSRRFDPSDTLDMTLNKATSYNVADESGKVYDILFDFAKTQAPEFAGWSMANSGAGGTRLWAIASFGREAGEKYFKSLPKDLQGGIRIRLPFYRDAQGVPKAWNVPGIGAGRLSERSRVARSITDYSEEMRDYMRNMLGYFPMKYLSGESGDLLYDALRGWGIRAKTVKTDGGGKVTYNDYTNRQKMAQLANVDDVRMKKVMTEKHLEASSLYTQGIERYGRESYHELYARYFFDKSVSNAARSLFESGSMTAEEMSAYRAATLWRKLLDDYGEELLDVHNYDGEQALFTIKNMVPRRETEEMILKRASESGFKNSPTRIKYEKHRSAFGDVWELTQDGDAVVLKWGSLENINNMYSKMYGVDAIYKEDPRAFMGIYLAEIHSNLLDRKLINFANRTGILRKLDTSHYPMDEFVNPTMVQQRIAEALARPIEGVESSGTGWAVLLRQKLQDDFSQLSRQEGLALDGSLTSVAERMVMLVRGKLDDSTMKYGIAGPRRVEFDNYTREFPRSSEWVNANDGTRIVRNNDNSWTAFNPADVQIRNSDGSALSYFPTQAELNADGGVQAGIRYMTDVLSAMPGLKKARDNSYVEAVAGLRNYIMHELDSFMAQPFIPLEMFANINQLPLHEQPNVVQATINAGYRWLRKFGADDARFDVTKSNVPKDIERAIKERTPRRSTKHTEWLERTGHHSVLNPRLEDLNWLSAKTIPEMKSMVNRHMEEAYAPGAVAVSMRRLFATYENPKSVGGVFWKSAYLPFYALQKVGMTLFRGTGFVIRNVNGGMWNGHLDGVGRADWRNSARLIIMFRKSQSTVRRQAGRELFNLNPASAQDEILEEFRRRAKATFTGRETFMADTDDYTAAMEIYKMFVNNGMSRGGTMNRVSSELLDNFNKMRGGRTTTVPTVDSRGKIVQSSVQTGGEQLEILNPRDRGYYARIMSWLAFDNPWIRHVMGPITEYSEDYLRLAAFIKGVREIGLEPPETGIRGYAASTWVKSTQFDYSDLSPFERQIGKAVLPFYTWTRYNVPLQIRAIVHEPGKIAQALRIRDSLAYTFGDENVEATPSFLTEKLGFEIPQESFDFLPENIRPAGNVGLGIMIGEPIGDIARWLRTPTPGGTVNPFNMREISQNLNPMFRALTATTSYLEGDPSMSITDQEPLPGFIDRLPASLPGINYDIDNEQKTTNRYALEFIRSMFPQLGVVERLIPGAGTERTDGRWFTSILSATLGLSVNTIDGWVRAGEQERLTKAVKAQIEAIYGSESATYRMQIIRELTSAGAPVEFISMLDIASMEKEKVDVGAAIETWKYVERLSYMGMMDGFDPIEIAVAMNMVNPDSSFNDEWVIQIYEMMSDTHSKSDRNRFMREYTFKKLKDEDLERLGIDSNQLEKMSDEELIELIKENSYRIARENG